MATLPAANTAEGGSNGTTVTTGNSGGTSGSAFDTVTIDAGGALVFDNAHPAHGTYAYKFTGSGSGGSRLEWNSTQTTVYGRAYIYFGSFPAGNTAIIDARDTGSVAASIRLNGTNKLDIYDGLGNLVAAGTTVLSTATLYRIEFQFVFNLSAGSITARLYAGDSSTITETITASSLNTGSQMTVLFWAWRPFTSDIVWMDDLVLNTTGYPGPATTAGTATPSAVAVAVSLPTPPLGILPLADNTAEGGTNGTTVTTGNSGGASGTAFDTVAIDAGGALTFDNTHPAHGTYGYKFAGSGSGGGRLMWNMTQGTVYGRAYIYAGSFPAGNTAIIDARNGAGTAAAIKIDAAKKLALYDGLGNLVGTGTTVLSAATTYRIEFKFVFHISVGSMTARLYVGDSGTVTETLAASALNTNTQMTLCYFSWRPFTADVAWMDDLNLNTTGYPGVPTAGTTPVTVAAAVGVPQAKIPTPLPRAAFVLRQAAQRSSSW